jgi:ABC-type glycerol-3-phosphate transport system substrate-binding protein
MLDTIYQKQKTAHPYAGEWKSRGGNEMRKGKLRSAALATSSAAALLAGAALAQEQTVSLGTWMYNEPGIGDWWHLAVAKFEADNPGARVEVRNLPVNDYMTQLVVELSSGNPADVVSVSANLPEVQASGGLVPLNDFIEASGLRERVEEACWNAVTFDGNVMAVPVAGRTLVLLYNEAMFEAAGLEGPPTTPEEFLEAARALTIKDAGGNVTQYGASMVNVNEGPTYEMLMMWTIAFGGALTDGENPTLTDPAAVEALTLMKTLYDEGLIPRGRGEDDQRALFANGGSAMEIDGPWQIPFVRQVNPDLADSISAARLPWDGPATGGPNVMIALGSGDNQDLAWKFVEAVMSEEIQSQFNEYSEVVPCGVGAIQDELLAEKPYLQPELEQFQAGPIPPSPAGFEDVSSEFQTIALEAVTNALQGGEDPLAALEDAQAELEAAFQ